MSVEIALTRDIDICLALRHAVFIGEQGVSEAEEVDGMDQDALHILARLEGVPIGTARILIKGDIAKIGRVCVVSQHRGTGIGAAIMQNALEVCRGQFSVKKALLGSQLYAMPFYEKLGFHGIGPIYLDAGIEHRDMEIEL